MSGIIRDLNNGRIAVQKDQSASVYIADNSISPKMLSGAVKRYINVIAIVGTASDVSDGIADYTSIQAAHDAVTEPGVIVALSGTYTETITWSKSDLILEGAGRSTNIVGAMVSTGDYNHFRDLRLDGNFTFNAGSDGNMLRSFWHSSGSTITDNGSGNSIQGILE